MVAEKRQMDKQKTVSREMDTQRNGQTGKWSYRQIDNRQMDKQRSGQTD